MLAAAVQRAVVKDHGRVAVPAAWPESMDALALLRAVSVERERALTVLGKRFLSLTTDLGSVPIENNHHRKNRQLFILDFFFSP